MLSLPPTIGRSGMTARVSALNRAIYRGFFVLAARRTQFMGWSCGEPQGSPARYPVCQPARSARHISQCGRRQSTQYRSPAMPSMIPSCANAPAVFSVRAIAHLLAECAA